MCNYKNKSVNTLCITFHFDIVHIRIHNKSKVARKSPGGGRPCNHTNIRIVIQGKVYNNCIENNS